jgi:hypothetical protein
MRFLLLRPESRQKTRTERVGTSVWCGLTAPDFAPTSCIRLWFAKILSVHEINRLSVRPQASIWYEAGRAAIEQLVVGESCPPAAGERGDGAE